MKIYILRFMLFFYCTGITAVQANCWSSSGGGTQTNYVNFGNVVVQRDVPEGTVIASRDFGYTVVSAIDCTNGPTYYLAYSLVYNGGISKGNHIYKTNVEGVGIRVHKSQTSTYFESPTYYSPIYAISGLTSFPSSVELIKTGPITGGAMNAGQIGEYYITNTSYGVEGRMTHITMQSGTTITPTQCSISTSNLSFPMGTIAASEFSGAVGFIPEHAVTQNLGLECEANANINVTLNGTQNPDVTTSSVLALTGQGDTGVAQGVGVQLLYNNKPLELNKRIVLKKSAGGQETFPIVARYYQTKTTVTPGKANTLATLNISYQ
ncbi:fimbrial protein [Siccibacter turicensis]